jgi:hypothetical protein
VRQPDQPGRAPAGRPPGLQCCTVDGGGCRQKNISGRVRRGQTAAEEISGRNMYAWQEPDAAGAAFAARIGADIPKLRVMAAPAGHKAVSAAHIAGRDVPAL